MAVPNISALTLFFLLFFKEFFFLSNFSLIYLPLLLSSFAGFSNDRLICILDTFAFIRLWWSETSNLGCDLTDLLLVVAFYDYNIFLNTDTYLLGKFIIYRMRKAKLQFKHIAFYCRSITNAVDLKLFFKPLSQTDNNIVTQRSVCSPVSF